jgi:hypothetical protein
VTWEKPATNGSVFDKPITYTVEVYLCTNQSSLYVCNTTAKDVQFSPREKNLTKTYVIVSNVVLKQEYKIKVISMSSLKNVLNDTWKFSEKSYTYEGVYYQYLFKNFEKTTFTRVKQVVVGYRTKLPTSTLL